MIFSRSPAVLDEVLAGLKLYFDKSLGNNLLYRFERAQYVEIRKAHAPKMGEQPNEANEMEPSSVYGAEHLLRLFGTYSVARTSSPCESKDAPPPRAYPYTELGC